MTELQKKIEFICTKAEYQELITNGSITKNGTTHTYDPSIEYKVIGHYLDSDEINALIAPIEDDVEQAQEEIQTKQPKNKVFSNIIVPTSAWVEEQTPTYTDYPYRADITCQGVSATDLVRVYYSDTDRSNTNLYDGGNRSANTVSIYAKETPESAVNIDYIIAEVIA